MKPELAALDDAVNRMRAALDGDTEYLPALLELASAVQAEQAAMLTEYAETV
jgi:hypothetical protein